MVSTHFDVEVMSDLQGFFKIGERERIYNCCNLQRDKVLIRLLWKSGRRISEILPVKVKDIDFQNANILWNILKKKKPMKKWKPVDKVTLKLLGDYILNASLEEEDYLINGGFRNKHISRQRAFAIIRRLCKKAGIAKVGNKQPHPHHFRHSFAIDIAKKTKSASDIRQVQMALEHSSLAMTEQYLQFESADLRHLIEEDED